MFYKPNLLAPSAEGPATTYQRVEATEAGFRAFLGNIHGKPSPRRFVEPRRDPPPKRDQRLFSEADLEAFFHSLNPQLVPASLAHDETLRRAWQHFWATKTDCRAVFYARYIEAHGKHESQELDLSELVALDHALTKAMLALDHRSLRSFIGRRGVDVIDLCFALWSSHAQRWFELAEAPAVLLAVRALLSAGDTDAVDHQRSMAERLGGEHRALPLGAGHHSPAKSWVAAFSKAHEHDR